jgi:hypothetical protein
MFFALGRLALMLLVVSTVAYVSLWFYARAVQKERLERRWEEEGRPGDRDLFVRQGLESDRYALRRRLLLGVYAGPFAVLAIVVYFANYA